MQIEVASDYYPGLTRWHVRSALKWIPESDIKGIHFIRLVDEDPEEQNAPDLPPYLRGFTFNGKYVQDRGQLPYIVLYTRDLYRCIPPLFASTPAATLCVARTLAHEVGHHVIESKGYVYAPTEKYKSYGVYDEYKEKMCDRYAGDVINRMSTSMYYKLGFFLCRRISEFFFAKGNVVWGNKDYDRAAYYWFCSYMVDNTNQDAGISYQKAIKMLST